MADDGDTNEDEFRLPTMDRLKQSKKRRAQQLKKYAQFEKQLEKESGKRSKKTTEKPAEQKNGKRVQFPGSVTLLEAAARDDKDEVRRLLRMGINPDVSNDDGLTALHQCCIDDAEGMLSVLLEFGASVNATDCELWTPLHAAATCGRIRLCQALIEHGADLLAVNGDGNMPYDICDHDATLDYIEYEMAKQGITQDFIDETRLVREKRMLTDLKELHNKNGDLEFRGRNGETPLHIAAANGYEDVAKFLLTHRVRVDCVDNELWQPIHCAACWGQLCVLELLLEHGANLEAKTGTGSTAFDICEDVDMRQRILEIKEAVENSRIAKSREISRRHSSTIRSASVRRTSMREKNEMSWKEAKEEGRKMRETEMLTTMDDEDVAKENGQASASELNKSSVLSPLVSVDEALDVRFQPSNTGTDKPKTLDIPSPTSPVFVGRGLDFGASSSYSCSSSAAATSSVVDTKSVAVDFNSSNGLPSANATGGQPPGTLPELKKQRSNNRLSDVRLQDADADKPPPLSPPPVETSGFHPSSPAAANKTSSSSASRTTKKCCVII